jgi:hypothetical protein
VFLFVPSTPNLNEQKESTMSANQHSRRFNPNTLTEKIVPVLLVLLVVILLAVFVVIGLALVGVIPSA